MSEHGKIEELAESLKQYVNINYELGKLEATERSSVIGAEVISTLVVVMVAVLFVFFISIGGGFYLSALVGDSYSGFLIVAGFYFLLGLILMLSRKKLIENPMRNKIIQRVFSKN